MLKKYWIEIFVTLLMTGALVVSFSSQPPEEPPSTAARDRILQAYQTVPVDKPFLEGDYRKDPLKNERSWTIKVWPDGRVSSEVEGKISPSKLEPSHVKSLLDRLRRESMLDLREKLPKEVSQQGARLKLKVRLQGGETDLQLSYPLQNTGDKGGVEVRRFLRSWAEMLTEVPSPNGEKPLQYL